MRAASTRPPSGLGHPFPAFYPTEADALAAVDAFMQEYLAASSAFVRSGGSEEEPLRELTSAQQLRDERDFAATLASQGDRFQGSFGYFGLEIQHWTQDSADQAFLQAYVCLDYRSSSYLRADGTTFEGLVQWAPFEAIMTSNTRRIRLEELREWTGRNFCDLAQQRSSPSP